MGHSSADGVGNRPVSLLGLTVPPYFGFPSNVEKAYATGHPIVPAPVFRIGWCAGRSTLECVS